MRIKENDVVVGIALVVCSVLVLLFGRCEPVEAQERSSFMVEDFKGIDVSGDSTNLDPSEALDIINLTPKFRGSLTVREGYSFLTPNSFGEPLTHINIYKPYSNVTRLVAVDSTGFVYMGNISGDVFGKIHIHSPDGDSMVMQNPIGDDTAAVVVPAESTWFKLYAQPGDFIQFFPPTGVSGGLKTIVAFLGGTSGTDTVIFSPPNGTSILEDTASHTIWRIIQGEAYTEQYQDKLYICDSEGFPIVYNDTAWQFLTVVDSGHIEATSATSVTLSVPSIGKAHIDIGSNKVISDEDTISWIPVNGIDTANYFYYYYRTRPSPNLYPKQAIFQSEITDIDSAGVLGNTVLTLANVFNPATGQMDYWNNYGVKEQYYGCSIGSGVAAIDSTKNWLDIVMGTEYLSTFFNSAVSGTGSWFPDTNRIACNNEHSFTANGIPPAGRRYVINSFFPFAFDTSIHFTSDTTKVKFESPRFSKITFHLNQLYGIGFDRENNISEDNRQRIWYSGINLPFYMLYNYNFDVTRTEKTTTTFSLSDNLYVGTNSSIWLSTGIPILRETSGSDQYPTSSQNFNKITQQLGIPDWDNVIKADENYGYFVNRQGVFRLTNTSIQRMGIKIEPIIEQNFDSEIVTVYLNKELYVSFPDSNFSLVYNETYDLFYKIDFAFVAAFVPPDTNIMYFVHSEHPDRIYTYPNGEYWDRNSAADSSEIAITYKPGWQSYDRWWLQKKPYWTYYDMDVSDTVTWKLFQGFSETVVDSLVTDSTQLYGRYVYRDPHPNSAFEEYFRYELTGSTDTVFTLMGYRSEWTEPDQKIK